MHTGLIPAIPRARTSRYPGRAALPLHLVLIAAGLQSCTSNPKHTEPAAPEFARVSAKAGGNQPTTVPPDIHAVLRKWSTGDQEGAIAALLELAESKGMPGHCRLSELSEEQFVRVPTTRREVLKEEMLVDVEKFRAVLDEVERRAAAAADAGNIRVAEKLLRAMRYVAAANTGAQMTLLSDMVGRAYVKRADERLSALHRSAERPR